MAHPYAGAQQGGGPASLFGVALEAFDARLRRRRGVVEFSRSPHCVYRMEIARSDKGLILADGTALRPGDRYIDLHLWNDHFPSFPASGATLAWARRVVDALEFSLFELADHLARRPDLADVALLRADIGLAPAQRGDQIRRVAERVGFQEVRTREPTCAAERLRRLGENIFISMLVLAHNPASLRADSLQRGRAEAFMSLPRLMQRYGPGSRERERPRND